MDLQRASKLVERYKNDVALLSKKSADIGGGVKDTTQLRAKIQQLRIAIGKSTDAVGKMLLEEVADAAEKPALVSLRSDFAAAKREFQKAETAIHHKEADHVLPTASSDSSAQQGNLQQVGVPIVELRSNELATIERLQLEKCQNALEIEQSSRELHSAVHEFNALAKEQQVGVDIMTKNIKETGDSMDKGAKQLQKARKLQ
jgi:aminopeptidase N